MKNNSSTPTREGQTRETGWYPEDAEVITFSEAMEYLRTHPDGRIESTIHRGFYSHYEPEKNRVDYNYRGWDGDIDWVTKDVSEMIEKYSDRFGERLVFYIER